MPKLKIKHILLLHKIKYETYLTCDEIHESTIKYKEINGRTITTYQNKIAFAHWCLDEKGNYYLGYEYEWQCKIY